jgi:nitrite reductase/ring-hydroxylating ferredoxin subunit
MNSPSRLLLCHRDDIPNNGSKGFEVAGTALFAVGKRGRLFLYRNRCPHLGLPLNWVPDQFLDHDSELIQCASHGALFRIDSGQCVAGPCAGEHLGKIEFEEIEGAIWIDPRQLSGQASRR